MKEIIISDAELASHKGFDFYDLEYKQDSLTRFVASLLIQKGAEGITLDNSGSTLNITNHEYKPKKGWYCEWMHNCADDCLIYREKPLTGIKK